MHIIIDEIQRRLHLHSFGQPVAPRTGAALQAWPSSTDLGQARSFIDRHFRDAARLHFLRHALAQDGHEGAGPAQRSDDDVLQTAARRVASGAWRIAFEVAAATNVARPVPAPAASPLLRGAGHGGSTRTSQRPLPASRAPARAPAPAPAAALEWTDSVAQRAQAETLRSAARDGTPFCEICEANRRARAEAAA